MNENRIEKALKLLQEAQTILEDAARTEPTSDNLAIEYACRDLDQPIEAVGELVDAYKRGIAKRAAHEAS